MNAYVAIPIIEASFSGVLLVLLMICGQRHIARRPFSLFLIFMALWGFFIFMMRSSANLTEALFWERYVLWAILSAALFFFRFAAALTGIKLGKLATYPIYLAYFIFMGLIPTGFVVSGMQELWYGKAPVIGPLFFPFVLSAYAPIVLAMAILLKHSRQSRQINERTREQYILAGILAMFIGGTTDYMPSLGLSIYPLGIIGDILFCILATIAMLRYGLLEIKVVLRRSATYSLFSMIIFGFFGSLLFLLSKIFQELSNPISLAISLTTVFVVAAVFQPVLSRMQRVVERWFFRERYDHIQSLRRFGEETRGNLELKQLASSLITAIINGMQSRGVCLLLPSTSNGDFVLYSHSGPASNACLHIPSASPLVTTMQCHSDILDTNDIDIIPSLSGLGDFEKRGLADNDIELMVPLKNVDRLVGIILIASKISSQPYSNEERQLLRTVAVGAGANIENASRYETIKTEHLELQQAMEGVIHAVSLIVEARDPYTAGHQRRVAELARTIAEEMGLSDWQVKGIHIAGLLHDVGKVAIPVEILSKPGRLNDHEFSLIKNHPQVGYEALRKIEFPWPITKAVLQHHERLNGSGYPGGLTGKDIVLEARVVSVADVVEAMSSHRPYRPALGLSAALEEIAKSSDILYDSKVVDACLRLFRKDNVELEKLIADAVPAAVKA